MENMTTVTIVLSLNLIQLLIHHKSVITKKCIRESGNGVKNTGKEFRYGQMALCMKVSGCRERQQVMVDSLMRVVNIIDKIRVYSCVSFI
jgi:hypothetical protein